MVVLFVLSFFLFFFLFCCNKSDSDGYPHCTKCVHAAVHYSNARAHAAKGRWLHIVTCTCTHTRTHNDIYTRAFTHAHQQSVETCKKESEFTEVLTRTAPKEVTVTRDLGEDVDIDSVVKRKYRPIGGKS